MTLFCEVGHHLLDGVFLSFDFEVSIFLPAFSFLCFLFKCHGKLKNKMFSAALVFILRFDK